MRPHLILNGVRTPRECTFCPEWTHPTQEFVQDAAKAEPVDALVVRHSLPSCIPQAHFWCPIWRSRRHIIEQHKAVNTCMSRQAEHPYNLSSCRRTYCILFNLNTGVVGVRKHGDTTVFSTCFGVSFGFLPVATWPNHGRWYKVLVSLLCNRYLSDL